ncbi:MAG: hypothetical protein DMF64_09480 [Acidobacteria bacterium]|nr:MAG: hypothetical protein DMF64_09480 [Acidobacteriota bacterium]
MMKQLTRRTLVAVSALVLCAVCPVNRARANVGDAISNLTIYDAGIAEFHEERTLVLQAGLNQLEWRSLMPKAYIRTLRVTADGAEVIRQDVTYDGADVRNEKSPVLHLVLRSAAAGAHRVQVDYLAPGINWQNDYALVLEPTAEGAPPTAAVLDSWVSVFNNTGTDVSSGLVDLIAGEIAFRLDGNAYNNLRAYAQVAQSNVAYDEERSAAAPTVAAEVSGVSAFSRFRLGRDLTFNANAPVNRLPLFQRARLAVVERNVFENEYNTQTLGRGGFTLLPRGLEVRLVAKNTTEATMPAGEVTIYARQDELTQVVGQDRIALTPPNNEFSVTQGRSATLFGTRRILERRQVDYRNANGDTRTKLITSVEVVLTNRGRLAAEAYIREGIEGFAENQWTILESSVPSERLGASGAQFKVQVPAGGKTTVTYTVETK